MQLASLNWWDGTKMPIVLTEIKPVSDVDARMGSGNGKT